MTALFIPRLMSMEKISALSWFTQNTLKVPVKPVGTQNCFCPSNAKGLDTISYGLTLTKAKNAVIHLTISSPSHGKGLKNSINRHLREQSQGNDLLQVYCSTPIKQHKVCENNSHRGSRLNKSM